MRRLGIEDMRGQHVGQTMGGIEVGSRWGYGSDVTRRALEEHREAMRAR